MQSVKKAITNLVEKEQKRVILVTLAHDGELCIKGDNLSFTNLGEDDEAKEALKRILKHEEDNSETSYNFGQQISYMESQNFDFPKMFAKIGKRNWKGGEIAKVLGKYFALLGFGLNAKKSYGNAADKPAWWPKGIKWKHFKSPSKACKEENTLLIRCLLEHYGIDAIIHYVHYPEEEVEETSESSESDNGGWEGCENPDEKDSSREEDENSREEENSGEENSPESVPGPSLADRVNFISQQSLVDNPNIQRRERRMHELEEELRRYQLEDDSSDSNGKEKRKRKNYVEIQVNEGPSKSKKKKN